MRIDVPTLLVVLIGLCAMLGMAMLLRWLKSFDARYLLNWCIALLVAAASFLLLSLRDVVPDWLSIAIANALLLGALGVCWNGFRAFNDREASWAVVLCAPVAWLIACGVPEFYQSFELRSAAVWSAICLFSLAIGHEIWIRGNDRLSARLPIGTVCVVGAVVCAFRVVSVLGNHHGVMSLSDSWMAAVLLLAVFVIFGVTMLSLGMTQQRTERALRHQASLDGLTGLLNRSAFVAQASAQIEAAAREEDDIVLLLFDLDRFKQINDTFGHAAGDSVLVAFGEILRQALRATDAIGRVGGEEFAALLTGVDSRLGGLIAEGIRGDLARRTIDYDGVPIPATVSIGLAVARASETDLTQMMARSDRALYSAKRGGRDLVWQAAG